ncbi:toll-like receptor 13 [Homarus americanus]|uniref:toll-like receptor 13 n=1 Tax=Homarus americanus TaxID=6706 RepID=UPI001C4475B9|nr:toll-like receptor 13 [Homarus americanus]
MRRAGGVCRAPAAVLGVLLLLAALSRAAAIHGVSSLSQHHNQHSDPPHTTAEPPSDPPYTTAEPPSDPPHTTAEPPSDLHTPAEPPSDPPHTTAEPPSDPPHTTAEPTGYSVAPTEPTPTRMASATGEPQMNTIENDVQDDTSSSLSENIKDPGLSGEEQHSREASVSTTDQTPNTTFFGVVTGQPTTSRGTKGIARCFWVWLSQYFETPTLDFLDPLPRHLPPRIADEHSLAVSEVRSLEKEVRDGRANLPVGCNFLMIQEGTVFCTGNNITKIPEFGEARHIKILHFSGTGIKMVTSMDPLPRSLKSLTLSEGQLMIFEGCRFFQIAGLEFLSLEYNTLSSWSFVFAFYSKDAPMAITIKTLNLQNNLISYPPEPVGGNETVLPYLEVLAMNNNPLCNLPAKLFKPLRESPVKSLFLRNCSIGQFSHVEGSPLQYLKGLEILDLSKNHGLSPEELEELLQPLERGNLRELYLSNNNYGRVPTGALELVNETLEILDLHGSAFECLDNSSFPVMNKLVTLNLMYCRINTVQYDTFDGFPSLRELYLDSNGLVTVPPDVMLPTLHVLTLSDNPRNTGSGGPQTFNMDEVIFRNLDFLTNTSFDRVPLGQVRESYFNTLHNLQFLHLSTCCITHIDPNSFRNLSKLEKLYLNENSIQVLYNDTFSGLTSLTYLDLSNNKIVFQYNNDFTNSPSTLSLEAAAGPSSSSSRRVPPHTPVNMVRLTQQNGRHKRHTQEIDKLLDNGYSTTWVTVIKRSTSSVRQQQQAQTPLGARGAQPKFYLPFQGLHSVSHLDLSENEIRTIIPELWEDLHELSYLNLDSNNIAAWNVPNFYNQTNLSVLSLQRNSLIHLTKAMVKDFSTDSLVTVDLRFNVFQCDCTIASLNNTLNKTHFVSWSSYQCSEDGDLIFFLDYIVNSTCQDTPNKPTNLTPINTTTTILVSISVTLSLLLVAVTVYRKRWYVRYVMYNIRVRMAVQKEDSDQYLYDTFVCYSQADRQWVFEHLLVKLEDGGRYRVCVHERDFTVGQEITQNIINSVERSRKVIVVLSPSFVESSWCMFELQMATNKILDEKKSKLILLLLEVIPSGSQPKKLRLLLKTRTYLAWVTDAEGQKLFWSRLLKAITKPLTTEPPNSTSYM